MKEWGKKEKVGSMGVGGFSIFRSNWINVRKMLKFLVKND